MTGDQPSKRLMDNTKDKDKDNVLNNPLKSRNPRQSTAVHMRGRQSVPQRPAKQAPKVQRAFPRAQLWEWPKEDTHRGANLERRGDETKKDENKSDHNVLNLLDIGDADELHILKTQQRRSMMNTADILGGSGANANSARSTRKMSTLIGTYSTPRLFKEKLPFPQRATRPQQRALDVTLKSQQQRGAGNTGAGKKRWMELSFKYRKRKDLVDKFRGKAQPNSNDMLSLLDREDGEASHLRPASPFVEEGDVHDTGESRKKDYESHAAREDLFKMLNTSGYLQRTDSSPSRCIKDYPKQLPGSVSNADLFKNGKKQAVDLSVPIHDRCQEQNVNTQSRLSRQYEEKDGCLNCDSFFLGDTRAKAFANAIELIPLRVHELSLNETGLSSRGSSEIFQKLCKNEIMELSATQNRIGIHGCSQLADILMAPSGCLHTLNLADNKLGDDALHVLIQGMQYNTTLTHLNLHGNLMHQSLDGLKALLEYNRSLVHLDLSWNAIRGDVATRFCSVFKTNSTLQHLNLAHNNLGSETTSAGTVLAAALRFNASLQFMDLSNTQLKGKTAIVLADSLTQNQSLRQVLLNGNPIGPAGGAAILRAAVATSTLSCEVCMKDCNFDIVDPTDFIPSLCDGKYVLHLDDFYEAVVAQQLVDMALKGIGTMTQVFLNRSSILIERLDKDSHEAASKAPGLPPTGVLKCSFAQSNDIIIPSVSIRGFASLIKVLQNSFPSNDSHRALMIESIASDFSFTGKQANDLLRLFPSESRLLKAQVAATLIPRVADYGDLDELTYDCASLSPEDFVMNVREDVCASLGLDILSSHERTIVQELLGKWTTFNPRNPNGHYALNLANAIDRFILRRLIEANNLDKRYRLKHDLPDVSQQGNGQCLRNTQLDGSFFLVEESWAIPSTGLFECDLVLTKRPPLYCTALNDTVFERVYKELRNVPSSFRVKALLTLSSRYFITSRQLQRFMEQFGPYEKDSDGASYRVQVFCIFYSRVVDEGNMSQVLDILDRISRRQLFDRLGHANLFNPVKPSGTYELDLKVYDQRYVAQSLVELVFRHEGKMENMFLNGYALDLPPAWERDLPRRGQLRAKFVARLVVNASHQLPPHSYQKKLADLLHFKEKLSSEVLDS